MSEAQAKTNSMSHNRNQARVERDEAELQALLKEQGSVTEEDTDDSVLRKKALLPKKSKPQKILKKKKSLKKKS